MQLGREPTDEEPRAAAEVEVRDVRQPREIARVVTSLDRPVGEEEETTLGALLPSDADAPDVEVELAARDDALHPAPCSGCPRPSGGGQAPLRHRRDAADPAQETGRRLGISSDAVRKLERKALAELAGEPRARAASARGLAVRRNRRDPGLAVTVVSGSRICQANHLARCMT